MVVKTDGEHDDGAVEDAERKEIPEGPSDACQAIAQH